MKIMLKHYVDRNRYYYHSRILNKINKNKNYDKDDFKKLIKKILVEDADYY